MLRSLQKFNPTRLSLEVYEQLKVCEEQWWQARQRLNKLKEREVLWFGENSLMMWLLWHFVIYVLIAMLMMIANKWLNMSLSLGYFLALFGIQTLIFLMIFALRGSIANYLQNRIDEVDMAREQALSEMIILAQDSILPDIHAHCPITLQQIYERYERKMRLASIQRLLQTEIDSGRLLLDSHQIEAQVLPPELAEDELAPYAGEMIYRSLV